MIFWETAYARTISLPEASTMASKIDTLHDFIFWLSVFFLILITVGLVVFVMKFHRSKTGRTTEYILGSHFLETLWTVIPLILMLIIFAWGYRDYLALRAQAKDPVEINVYGRQWMWNFEYTNGRKGLNTVYIPKGKPVKFLLTSNDVIHSFFVPNFRLKQDVVPGMYTYLEVEATELGEHPIYCAEYCGTGHSDMLGKVVVLEQKDYDHWFETGRLPGSTAPASEDKAVSLVDKGKGLFESKGCFACHSTDGTAKVGPSFKDMFGRKEELQSGETITVDENYIRESLNEPQAKIVKGFPPSMPTFKGLLSEEEINALLAYIKSLK